jgi:hypothetical protein
MHLDLGQVDGTLSREMARVERIPLRSASVTRSVTKSRNPLEIFSRNRGPSSDGTQSKVEKTAFTTLGKRAVLSRSEMVRGFENGLIRLRLDQLKPFANVLGYSPEQILGPVSAHFRKSNPR